MRLRNKPGAQEMLEGLDFVYLNPKDQKNNWNSMFGNKNPIYIEIGMGKGKFLEQHFKSNSKINYIGIEKEKSVVYIPAKRFKDYEETNFKLVCSDVSTIEEWFEEKQISKIFINHPDPWPKKKHHKRRLMHKTFLEKYHKILTDEGTIEFKSDQKILYDFFLETLEEYKGFKITFKSENLHADMTNIVMTEYETKFTSEGKPIYAIFLQKVK